MKNIKECFNKLKYTINNSGPLNLRGRCKQRKSTYYELLLKLASFFLLKSLSFITCLTLCF